MSYGRQLSDEFKAWITTLPYRRRALLAQLICQLQVDPLPGGELAVVEDPGNPSTYLVPFLHGWIRYAVISGHVCLGQWLADR